MNTPKWIIVLTLIFALSMPATPVSAQCPDPATVIKLTPPTPNPALIGDDINFALVVDAACVDPGVAGIDIYIAYDPAFVAPSNSPLGVVEPLPDFFGPSNITWYEKLPNDQCRLLTGLNAPCIHLVAAGPAQETHSGAVARFHFQGIALAPPSTEGFMVLTSPKMVVDSNGFPVAPVEIALPNPQFVHIVNRSVTGNLLRQGMLVGDLACSQVRLISSGGVIFGPVFTDGAGNFTLSNPPSGVLTLRAEYPGYLTSEKRITISTGGPSFINAGRTELRGGDVNDDDRINILDVGTIISRFNTPAFVGSTCGADDPVDINDDEIVDISDLGIITGANWGLTGPTIWP